MALETFHLVMGCVGTGFATLGGSAVMFQYLMRRVETKQDKTMCEEIGKRVNGELRHGDEKFKKILDAQEQTNVQLAVFGERMKSLTDTVDGLGRRLDRANGR